MPEADDDAALALAARGGDQRAYGSIVARHKAAMHRLAARIAGDEDAALDIVQESFVAAFRALDRYDPGRPLIAWLMRITINKSRDWRRRRFVRHFVGAWLLIGGETMAAASDAPGADRIVEGHQEIARLEAAIARLPPRLREVLVLRTIEGLDQAETARVLGIGVKAVETRLYRARRRLVALLDIEG